MSVTILRANALALPLADSSVDLVVTSPPYFGLRSYQDGGEHYQGQIGSEATPVEFVDALIAATREMMRVLKPSGSIFVNLGDKYSRGSRPRAQPDQFRDGAAITYDDERYTKRSEPENSGIASKSLMGIPWRYAIRCIDDLGLILRAEIIWSKPNGLPESVTDRVRRSHEQWFHFTKEPRYFSAVDEIREPHTAPNRTRGQAPNIASPLTGGQPTTEPNPRGKLPGSVWTIATEPLRVPDHLGIDHFAAFPTEFPRRIITSWSPREVCGACGEGRRPVVHKSGESTYSRLKREGTLAYGNDVVPGIGQPGNVGNTLTTDGKWPGYATREHTITGYACACPDTSAPATPGVVLDPFGGTGNTALVADALGRRGVSVDLSADYCRLAEWRKSDPKQRAEAARRAATTGRR